MVVRRCDDMSNQPRPGLLVALLLFVPLLVGACATVGREFPANRVGDIALEQTTQSEIREMFGPPWRVGVEDGRTTWTYGRYRYRLFGEPSTSDLVVRFDPEGHVVSYSFSTTEHEERGD
jgi:hypothetical protein